MSTSVLEDPRTPVPSTLQGASLRVESYRNSLPWFMGWEIHLLDNVVVEC